MEQPIGIDLGTMSARVAGLSAAGAARILPDRQGRRSTPSTVAFDGRSALVGSLRPGAVRHVAAAAGDPTWRFPVAGMSLRVEEVAALILGRLRDDAVRGLGRPVTAAVLAVPACSDAAARQAVRQAGQLAGLVETRVVDAPTAVAVAGRDLVPVDGTALVLCLGGGATDVTVLHRDAAGLRLLATRGDRELGGWDWDNALLRLLHERVRAAGGPNLLHDTGDEDRLRAETEAAKRALSAGHRVELRLGGRPVAVTRAEFEGVTSALLDRARRLVVAALSAAGLAPSDVAAVLLSGGPTRMPMVRRMLAEVLGRAPVEPADPDGAVALGAALLGRSGQVGGIASLGLGALARDAATGGRRNVVVLPAGTPLPAHRVEVFRPVAPGQRRLVLEVTQGDATEPAAVRRLDRRAVALPPDLTGPLAVSCGYDLDQRPRVEVCHAGTGRVLAGFDAAGQLALSPAELAAATARLSAVSSGGPAE